MKRISSKLLAFMILPLFLAVCLLVLPGEAQAATYSDLTYKINNGEATITDCNSSASGALVIPSTLGGYPVTSIGWRAFSYCSSLTSITIPDSVTRIDEFAFSSCDSLTSITIPDSVTSIGSDAFYNCNQLQYNTYDNGKYLGNAQNPYVVFVDTTSTSITSCEIQENTKYIYQYAFHGCSRLTSITIPDSVTSIGVCAFQSCSSLTSITIGDSVTYIGPYAFKYCSSLAIITIGDRVTSIGFEAFYNCSKLKHVAYSGTKAEWKLVALDSYNSALTNAYVWHYDAKGKVYHAKNCVNSGMFCEICDDFLTKEKAESGSHTYENGEDMLCDDCGYIRSVKSIRIYQQPSAGKFPLFTGALQVTDGVLMATYSDGTTGKVSMTTAMVSGFDNTKLGAQVLTVTYSGSTATYTVEIVPGEPLSIEIKTLPNKVNYLTGQTLELSGLELVFVYENGTRVDVDTTYVSADSVDLTTPGVKTVTLRNGKAVATFSVYVHRKTSVTADSSLYPESSHNYASNSNETKTFTHSGADSLTLTFSSDSYTESGYDFVYIYDGNGNQIAKLSGNLSGKKVTIPGSTFQIKLTSDGSVNKYGYRFSSIVAEAIDHSGAEETVPATCTESGSKTVTCDICAQQTVLTIPAKGHSYENGECSACGIMCAHVLVDGQWQYADTITQALTTGSFVQLRGDHAEDVTVTTNANLDLNGFDLTGDITIADGATLYLFDSATADYTAENRGKVTGSITGNLARSFNTPASYGHNYKYMVIQEEDGSWSSHRYYLAVKSALLVPYTDRTGTAINYKTEFKCNDVAAQYIEQYGIKLTGDNTVYADHMERSKLLNTGADGSNVASTFLSGVMKPENSADENAANAEKAPAAQAYIQLSDGTELASAAVNVSVRELVAAVVGKEDLTQAQKISLGNMYAMYFYTMYDWAEIDQQILLQYGAWNMLQLEKQYGYYFLVNAGTADEMLCYSNLRANGYGLTEYFPATDSDTNTVEYNGKWYAPAGGKGDYNLQYLHLGNAIAMLDGDQQFVFEICADGSLLVKDAFYDYFPEGAILTPVIK